VQSLDATESARAIWAEGSMLDWQQKKTGTSQEKPWDCSYRAAHTVVSATQEPDLWLTSVVCLLVIYWFLLSVVHCFCSNVASR